MLPGHSTQSLPIFSLEVTFLDLTYVQSMDTIARHTHSIAEASVHFDNFVETWVSSGKQRIHDLWPQSVTLSTIPYLLEDNQCDNDARSHTNPAEFC